MLPAAARRRKSIRKFERSHSDLSIEVLPFASPGLADELIASYERWQQLSVTTRNDRKSLELPALLRQTRRALALPPQAVILRIAQNLTAFALYHRVPHPGVVNINHIKADYRVTDSFQYIFHRLMLHLAEAGISVANGEQDLGLAQLREYKTRLGPSAMLPRYIATRPS
jgi:hypothetical protein